MPIKRSAEYYSRLSRAAKADTLKRYHNNLNYLLPRLVERATPNTIDHNNKTVRFKYEGATLVFSPTRNTWIVYHAGRRYTINADARLYDDLITKGVTWLISKAVMSSNS